MAAVVIKGFAGMRPAINPRLLETGEAQIAKNCKLNNGSLRSMKSAPTVSTLALSVQTIYRYGDTASDTQYWLQFAGDVDVMKSPVNSDQYRRLYWSDGVYPKYAPESVFIGSGTYPSASYKLGIPKPGVKPSVAGSAVPVYTKENREYVVTYTKTGEETGPSTAIKATAVDGFAVKVTGLPVPSTSLAYTGKNLYRRDTNVNGSQFKLVAALAVNATEYTDEVKNANLGAVLSTSAVLSLTAPGAPSAAHDPIEYTSAAVRREYAYAYGGYFDLESSYIDEGGLSNVTSITVDTTQTVTVSGFAAAPGGATYRRIYRRDSTSSSFVRIAQIAVSQTSYVDTQATAVGTGTASSAPGGTLAGPTLSSSASSAITANNLTTFVYACTYVNASGTESKRSAESNAVKVVNGVTPVTVTLNSIPEGAVTVKVYRRTATVSNGVLGGSDADYRWVTTAPASTKTITDQASAASIASNEGMPQASYGTTTVPTGSSFASGTIPADVIPDTRVYVYTFVSAYGEEGPPSDPSTSVDVDPSKPVSLTAMAVAPSGPYNITLKRIYRSSTGNQSTAFQFVAEIPVANTSYTDSTDQADLGEVLPSEGWNPPPETMTGLTLGANGIAIGFVDNTVHICEPFQPHAWPSKYQQTSEHKIVGVAAFQQSFAILTTSYPYILSGSDSASMTMVKLEAPQACVSKRSICSTGTGVVYASPDGLVSIGTDGIRLLTSGLLNREQWQAYTPSSMLIRQYNNKIYVFHSTGLIVLDFTGESASMTVFDQTANAAYYDPLIDGLFIAKNGTGILKWDSGTDLTYTWKTKLITQPSPVNFAFGQVEADAYPVTFKVWAGGVLKHTEVTTDRKPFRLPSGFKEKDWEVQLEGTGQVFMLAMSETIHEMRSA